MTTASPPPPSPRRIIGSAGSRIKVILGDTGDDYLSLFNEDDGNSEWQSTSSSGIPRGLKKQIRSIRVKGRYITQVAFGACKNEWFVRGEKRDGSGDCSWWGNFDDDVQREQVMELSNSSTSNGISFGNPGSIAVIKGRRGYAVSGINDHLLVRMKRINANGKGFKFVRIFQNDEYFVSDDEGTQWSMSGPLAKELKSGGSDPILDVCVAGDGSWIVIRPKRFTLSNGVSKDLKKRLRSIYFRHHQRQNLRSGEIKKHMAKVRRDSKEERNNKKRMREELEQDERESLVATKRLRPGTAVTAIGVSEVAGDTTVKRILPGGAVEVVLRDSSNNSELITIKDPRLLAVSDDTYSTPDYIYLMCAASDKYEAALSVYYCKCHAGVCACAKVFGADFFLPDSSAREKELLWTVGQRAYVTGFAVATVIAEGRHHYDGKCKLQYDDQTTDHVDPTQLQRVYQARPHNPLSSVTSEVQSFDEYKCVEKIDLHRLDRLLKDLSRDSKVREDVLRRLSSREADNPELKKMKRCKELEHVAIALKDFVSALSSDQMGHVEFEVDYEHRDASARGRLFAKGLQIKVDDSKYPRTTSLQGMHKDLRAPLVGQFAYDIDCENSEVRLLCSLALQLKVKDLIPTLFDYRDNRQVWIKRISDLYSIPDSDAKRLPNIIISGGMYDTWIRAMGKDANMIRLKDSERGKQVKGFVFRLRAEAAALRDNLLQHPRFRWTQVDREKLKADGRRGGAIDIALLPRIVQCCENEVLGIMHRCFFDKKWIVRSKVFDGLIVERGPSATVGLKNVMAYAECAALARGWDIRISEKPLHGQQDSPIDTIEQARLVTKKYIANQGNLDRSLCVGLVEVSKS